MTITAKEMLNHLDEGAVKQIVNHLLLTATMVRRHEDKMEHVGKHPQDEKDALEQAARYLNRVLELKNQDTSK